MTRLAPAAGLGLLATTVALALPIPALQGALDSTLATAARADDDRGSGRLSRVPTIADALSFRGSGRVDPNPSEIKGSSRMLAYRGSGRITEPSTTQAS